MLRPREFVCALLLQAAWAEVQHLGGVKPMQVVAQCIGNRVRLGWGDWHQVLGSLAVYSALNRDALMVKAAGAQLPKANDPRFTQMLSLIDQAYDNSGEQLSAGATLWADISQPISSEWFIKAIEPNAGQFKRCGGSAQLLLWK